MIGGQPAVGTGPQMGGRKGLLSYTGVGEGPHESMTLPKEVNKKPFGTWQREPDFNVIALSHPLSLPLSLPTGVANCPPG